MLNFLSKLRGASYPYTSYMVRLGCIFIHVPKTAGTSILQALGDEKRRRYHLPWQVYYEADRKKFERYFKFSFVRNPWVRACSAYQYLLSGGNKTTDADISARIREYKDFDDFVIQGLGKGYFRNHILFWPQANFLLSDKNAPVVDFLGRVESLTRDYPIIAERLKLNTSLIHANKTVLDEETSDVLYYEKDKSVNIIESIYLQDIESFGYRFHGKDVAMGEHAL